MADFYEYSTPELVRLLGERFKEYRMRCNLTQKEVAEQSGIGLTTIHKFENGTASTSSRMVRQAICRCQHSFCS